MHSGDDMPTIQQVIDRILADLPMAMPADTVDTIKSGDPALEARGIVTTFMSTWDVLQKAAAAGANFVITHEPTFYNHRDETEWLAEDPLYQAKQRLINDNGLTIWRFHDGWHMHNPDGILAGAARELGWEVYQDAQQPYLFHIPAISLRALAEEIKAKTGASQVRAAGSLDMLCRDVVMMPGSGGGEWHIEALGKFKADVVICGEAPEWQTPEYARDAVAAGLQKGLLILGHERSEEAGMALLAEQLRAWFPGLPITHIPSGDPLVIV
jgi:putative NIF3 family GTP cyclohydrolase 1 type 2